MRILLGAFSGQAMGDRRRLCAETWFPKPTTDVMAMMLLGGENKNGIEERDGVTCLSLPCPDDYHSLTQRTRCFCEWALRFGDWDYLFKCDDDTYVAIDRLIQFDTGGRDYIGANPWKHDSRVIPYASGGAGYFLSRRAAEIVARNLRHSGGAEDKLVGRILRRHGINVQLDDRFVPFGSELLCTRKDNDIITTHKVSEDIWRSCHAALTK